MTTLEQRDASLALPLQSMIEQGILTPTAFHVGAVITLTERSDEDDLSVVPEFLQWAAIGGWLGTLTDAVKWWIADWLAFGAGAWGERYEQAADATGLEIRTLENWAYTARQVMPSRRREDLSFTCHYAVAKLDPPEQIEWLGYAAKQKEDAPPGVRFGSRELRSAIKESGGKVPGERIADTTGDLRTNGSKPEHLNADAVIRAATRCWREAQPDGDAVRIPRDTWAGLETALGKGD